MRLSLTDEQLKVVEGPRGLFVSAAAGSGKTRVLTGRFIASVLGERGEASPMDAVLTMTFTEKAAGEIAERIRGALLGEKRPGLARQTDEAWISTIHGMCSRILRRHAFEAGVDPRFTVMTEVEAAVLGERAFEEAARELMERDRDVEGLVVDLGAMAVAEAVATLYAKARSLGAHARDLRLPEEPTADEGRLCRDRIATIAEDLGRLPRTETTARNADHMVKAAAALDRFLAVGTPEAAMALLAELPAKALAKHGTAAAKALAEAGSRALDEARAYAADRGVRPFAGALRALLVAFERRFDELKDERGVLDFEDLQLKTAELLERHPGIATTYQEHFAEVMVDEFQDTNALQLRVVRALGKGDVLTVGDDKQSIYRFRNADVEVFRQRAAEVEERATLRDNYRSHPEILSFVNRVFDGPEFFGGDFVQLEAQREADPNGPLGRSCRVEMLLTDVGATAAAEVRAAEAQELARRLRQLHDAGIPNGDMVLLLRAMQGRAEVFETALRAEGLPVYVASGGTYFRRAEVGDLLALLRVIDNPRDDEAVLRFLAGRMCGLGDSALAHLASARGLQPLWSLVASEGIGGIGLSSRDEMLLRRAFEVVSRLRGRRGQRRVSQLIHEACELTDYDLTLFASGDDGLRAWANVLKLARLADDFELAEPGDLAAFLHHVAAERAHGDDRPAPVAAEDVDAVRIMSIHSAKGLEFPVVAVGDLASSRAYGVPDAFVCAGDPPALQMRLPKALSPTGDHVETRGHAAVADAERQAGDDEAKRLFYVACTRARDLLVLSGTVRSGKEPTGVAMLDRVRRTLGLDATFLDSASQGESLVPVGPSAHLRVLLRQPDRVSEEVACPALPAVDGDLELPPLHDREDAVRSSFVPQRISYSGLALYRTCPYRFYLEKVLGLRSVAGIVGTGGGPAAFGSALHAAMLLEPEAGTEPSRLRDLLRRAGAHAGEEAVERLSRSIEAFAASRVAAEVASAERVHRECPILLPIGRTLLTGSIDLIAWSGARALIVDYKTGAGDLTADVARERFVLQAQCYGLAALAAGAGTVEVVFSEVERGCRETRFTYNRADRPGLERVIETMLRDSAEGRFEPLARYDAHACAECPAFGGLCGVSGPSRRAGAAARTRR